MTFELPLRLAVGALLVVFGSACERGEGTGPTATNSSHPAACEPGRQVSCPCPEGSTSVQVCRTDGAGWEPCRCQETQNAGGAATVDTGSRGGAGALGVGGAPSLGGVVETGGGSGLASSAGSGATGTDATGGHPTTGTGGASAAGTGGTGLGATGSWADDLILGPNLVTGDQWIGGDPNDINDVAGIQGEWYTLGDEEICDIVENPCTPAGCCLSWHVPDSGFTDASTCILGLSLNSSPGNPLESVGMNNSVVAFSLTVEGSVPYAATTELHLRQEAASATACRMELEAPEEYEFMISEFPCYGQASDGEDRVAHFRATTAIELYLEGNGGVEDPASGEVCVTSVVPLSTLEPWNF